MAKKKAAKRATKKTTTKKARPKKKVVSRKKESKRAVAKVSSTKIKGKGGLKMQAIEKELKALSGWEPNKNHTMIAKSFPFPSFISGLAFVAKITVHAEVVGHHPDIELSYGKVTVKLTTYDVKALTKKDFEMAERVDGIRLRY
mgnify:CR=1 FL=1